jgi:hypothetical protein
MLEPIMTALRGSLSGPNTTDQEEHDLGNARRRECQPEIRSRAREVENGEGKGHRRHRRTQQRDDTADEEQAELSLSERSE